jgi:hypothetical protein
MPGRRAVRRLRPACEPAGGAAAQHRDGDRLDVEKTFPALRRGRASGSLGDDRVYVYHFPPLAECRKRFDELIQGRIDWGSPGSGFFDLDEWEKEPPPDR